MDGEKLFSFIVLVVFALWYFGHLPPFNETTAYVAICIEDECKKDERSLHKLQYKVSFDTQQVVATQGILIRRLDDCRVFNAKNWDCEGEMMVDGWLSSVDDSTVKSKTMGKIEWHFARLKKFVQ